jgi:hypothetical protein
MSSDERPLKVDLGKRQTGAANSNACRQRMQQSLQKTSDRHRILKTTRLLKQKPKSKILDFLHRIFRGGTVLKLKS